MHLKNLFPFSLFSSSLPSIGIELDGQFIRLAQVRIKKGKVIVELLREVSINDSKKLFEGVSKKYWVTILIPQRKVMVRNISIKSGKIKDALQALAFELEPKLPFAIDTAIIQTKVEKIEKNEVEISAYVCEKNSIKDFLSTLKLKSLFADSITCVADSLAHLFLYDSKQKETENIFITIGEEETTVVLAKKGRVLAQQSFLTHDKQLGLSIQRTVLNYSQRDKKKFSNLYLFGRKAPQFSSMIQEVTKKNVFTLSLFDTLSENEWRTFAPAIGAALSQYHHPINFRQKEFSQKFPYKREMRPMIFSLTLSLLCACMLLFAKNQTNKNACISQQKNLASIFHFLNQSTLEENRPETPSEFLQLISHLGEQLRERNFEAKQLPIQISEILQNFSKKLSEAEPPLQGAKILDFQWEIKKRATPQYPRIPYEIEVKIILECASADSKPSLEKLLSQSAYIDQHHDISITIQDKIATAQFYLAQERG